MKKRPRITLHDNAFLTNATARMTDLHIAGDNVTVRDCYFIGAAPTRWQRIKRALRTR